MKPRNTRTLTIRFDDIGAWYSDIGAWYSDIGAWYSDIGAWRRDLSARSEFPAISAIAELA